MIFVIKTKTDLTMLKLDLHDKTLEEAYQKCQEFINEAYINNLKKVEIITGKSGSIRREFPFWAENNHRIQYTTISEHGGSFVVKIEKKF